METDALVIEPMREDLLLWRCLHDGPLDSATIDKPGPNPQMDWERIRARNLPLIERLTAAYGACAIIAREGAEVVATLRFYPKELCAIGESGEGFCLQQEAPAGPSQDLGRQGLPPQDKLQDQTLFVHCLMIAPAGGGADRRRKGLGTRIARELVRWASENGWEAIEAGAFEEIPILYAISGIAGRRFWERLGFRVVHEDVEPGITGDLEVKVRREAEEAGIPAARATARFRMRLELPASPRHLTG